MLTRGLSQGACEQERRICSRRELSQGAREQGRRFCSRGGLSQGAREQERRFCLRRELPQGAREQGRRFCSRRGASKSLEPGNHPGDHLGREGLLDVFIFRDLAGDAVLEKVVQAILRTDDAPAVGRQAGLQSRYIPIALDLSAFCAIPRHDRAGYAGKAGGQIQA